LTVTNLETLNVHLDYLKKNRCIAKYLFEPYPTSLSEKKYISNFTKTRFLHLVIDSYEDQYKKRNQNKWIDKLHPIVD